MDRRPQPIRVVSGPSVEAIGESIRVRRCAPGRIVGRGEDWDRVRGENVANGAKRFSRCVCQMVTVLTCMCLSLDPLGRSGLTERLRVSDAWAESEDGMRDADWAVIRAVPVNNSDSRDRRAVAVDHQT